MPLQIFEIELKNPQNSYFAGQVISGVVHLLVTEKSKTITGIKLKLQGNGKTSWKETIGQAVTNHYSEEEVYTNEEIYLLGNNSKKSEIMMAVGEHNFPFSFTLAESLPSSFCHKYGRIKYQLEATVKRSCKSNYTTQLPFTLIGIVDLNLESYAKHKGEISNEKTISCFCLSGGRFGFEFKVPRKGFFPGQSVPFELHMFNYTKKPVHLTCVSVVQKLKFIIDKDKTKTKTVEICSIKGSSLESGEEKDWTVTSSTSRLTIPSCPPSRLDGCKIISISYNLKVTMGLKGGSTLVKDLPIFIGTTPLQDDLENNCYSDFPPTGYEVTMDRTKSQDFYKNSAPAYQLHTYT